MYRVALGWLLIAGFLPFMSASAQTTTFTDNFNRPDGPVGNGWLDTAGNISGNLEIRNGAVSAPNTTGSSVPAGIYRPINLSGPVTVSAQLTHGNGYGGLLNRYTAAFLFGNSGDHSSGNGVFIYRADQLYANSQVCLQQNGTITEVALSSFQFGISIAVTVTLSPDGRIAGTVAGDGNTFNFSFGPRAMTLPGSNVAIVLEPDDPASPLVPTVDDITITHVGLVAQPTWEQKSPTTAPTARYHHTMAYDSARRQIVLFGGLDWPNALDDTWVWDGTNWMQKTPVTRPPGRYRSAMASDGSRGQTILFGGSSGNDTWLWDGTNWAQRSPANSPPWRMMHAMAFDGARGQVVLFGGTGVENRDDTWVWDGSNWTQKSLANRPPGRVWHAMAYDETRMQVVLFGGQQSGSFASGDTWVWDGVGWTQKYPVNSPPSRAGHMMAYDETRQKVVLFGGTNIQNYPLNDTWLWDGTNWVQETPANVPLPRDSAAMAYDGARGQVVLFGGWKWPNALRDTWVWSGASTSPTGTISVTTNLSAASFTITGPANYSGSGTSFTQTGAPAGIYTITYGAVNCFTPPASETTTLVPGGVVNFSPANYQGRATISVSIAPAGTDQATFTLSPVISGMRSSGPYPVIQSGVWPQSYKVTYNNLPGFTSPPSQTLAPDIACRAEFAGYYTRSSTSQTALLSVSTNNVAGKFTINGGAAMTFFPPTSLPVGVYIVRYEPVSGHYTPPDQTVVLKPGDLPLEVKGKYRRLLLVSFTGWNNAPNESSCWGSSPSPGSGVQYYPDQWGDDEGRGVVTLLLDVLADSALKPGANVAAFTFYTTDGNGNYLGNACTPPSVPSDLLPLAGDHRQAGNWLREQIPTVDDIIAVVGHSYGGNRARFFVEQLKRAGFTADLLVTIDPIDWGTGVSEDDGCKMPATLVDLAVGCDQSSWTRGPSSARSVISYYQLIGLGWNGLSLKWPLGYRMSGADSVLNGRASHLAIDQDKKVHRTILDALVDLVRLRH